MAILLVVSRAVLLVVSVAGSVAGSDAGSVVVSVATCSVVCAGDDCEGQVMIAKSDSGTDCSEGSDH